MADFSSNYWNPTSRQHLLTAALLKNDEDFRLFYYQVIVEDPYYGKRELIAAACNADNLEKLKIILDDETVPVTCNDFELCMTNGSDRCIYYIASRYPREIKMLSPETLLTSPPNNALLDDIKLIIGYEAPRSLDSVEIAIIAATDSPLTRAELLTVDYDSDAIIRTLMEWSLVTEHIGFILNAFMRKSIVSNETLLMLVERCPSAATTETLAIACKTGRRIVLEKLLELPKILDREPSTFVNDGLASPDVRVEVLVKAGEAINRHLDMSEAVKTTAAHRNIAKFTYVAKANEATLTEWAIAIARYRRTRENMEHDNITTAYNNCLARLYSHDGALERLKVLPDNSAEDTRYIRWFIEYGGDFGRKWEHLNTSNNRELMSLV